ncbi:MAG: hypothetical protein KAW52_03950 [candidate division Zixibacteria bacterium]|nr:hypothetical protein [candidate division Zixibacteria bacterium]
MKFRLKKISLNLCETAVFDGNSNEMAELLSVSKNHKNVLYINLTTPLVCTMRFTPLAGEESNKFNMLQIRDSSANALE